MNTNNKRRTRSLSHWLLSSYGQFALLKHRLTKQICQPQTGTCCGCLPSVSTRIKLSATAAADLQHPLKEFKVESRNEALGTLGTLQDRSLDGQYSQELILWAQFLYILISRKALKSFMVTIVSGVSHEAEASWDQQKFSTKFLCVWLHVFPLCQNHICTVLSPLPLWNSLSEFTEVLSSGLQSLFCPKWNLTRNSHIVQFF